MEDLLLILMLLVGPVGVFLVWHLTPDRKAARGRMVLVLLGAAFLGLLDARDEDGLTALGVAMLVASPGVLPAIGLSFLGRELAPLPEALACLILAFFSFIIGAGIFFSVGLGH